jgi:hypothetical protein
VKPITVFLVTLKTVFTTPKTIPVQQVKFRLVTVAQQALATPVATPSNQDNPI